VVAVSLSHVCMFVTILKCGTTCELSIYCYLCDKVNLDFHIHWIIKSTDFIAVNDASVTSSLLCFRAILFIGFNVDATFRTVVQLFSNLHYDISLHCYAYFLQGFLDGC
jgi:hypothetical protein